MADEELTSADEENVTEPQETEPQETEPAETQPTETTSGEKWPTRYRSPEEVFQENSRLQSRIAKMEAQLKEKDVNLKPLPEINNEAELARFVANPGEYVKSKNEEVVKELGSIKADLAMNSFLSDPENQKRFGKLKDQVVARVGGDKSALADPTAMKAVFLLVEDEMNSAKMQFASELQAGHRKNVEETKNNAAFLEGSTATKKSGSPKITPGMSMAEMEKILDDQGIPEEPE